MPSCVDTTATETIMKHSLPKGSVFYAECERFTFPMPAEVIEAVSGSGQKDDDVDWAVTRFERPAHVTPELLSAELEGYGAWGEEERADDEQNWKRLVWLAGNQIMETPFDAVWDEERKVYRVEETRWESTDGTEWAGDTDGPMFTESSIRFCGGPRDGEVIT